MAQGFGTIVKGIQKHSLQQELTTQTDWRAKSPEVTYYHFTLAQVLP